MFNTITFKTGKDAVPTIPAVQEATRKWNISRPTLNEDKLVRDALAKAGDFSQQEIEEIKSYGTVVTVPIGWVPMAQHTAPDKVYMILDGTAAIRKNKETIAHLGAGDIVGETSFATRRLRNATVVAESPLTVLHFTPENWMAVTHYNQKLSNKVNDLVEARA